MLVSRKSVYSYSIKSWVLMCLALLVGFGWFSSSPLDDDDDFIPQWVVSAPQEWHTYQQASGSSLLVTNLSFFEVRQRQITNYKAGKGLILNFHITHHGGTTTCDWGRANGPVPTFACLSDDNVPPYLKNFAQIPNIPWSHKKTDFYVEQLRKQFHFISWEFHWEKFRSSLGITNLEHPNLASIIIMRDPMKRLMSSALRHYAKNNTADEWWTFANSIHTDNYALRSLTSFEGCCNGEKTDDRYFEIAKSHLKRFTFIIDLECLVDSLAVLSELLDLQMPNETMHRNAWSKPSNGVYIVRDRIKNDTLYKYLVDRNAKDIELYNWAKEQALVKCPREAYR